MTDHLTPAQVCVRIFGSEAAISAHLGYNRTAPFHWHRPSRGRNAGDLPSALVMRKLHTAALRMGRDMPWEWLVSGAPAAEVDALLNTQAQEDAA